MVRETPQPGEKHQMPTLPPKNPRITGTGTNAKTSESGLVPETDAGNRRDPAVSSAAASSHIRAAVKSHTSV